MSKKLVLAAILLSCSCSRVRSVQLHPPILPPPGLVSGYGVEKIAKDPERARRSAYLKAIDDLLTRSGPVLVSKTVHDQTTVTDARSASRVLESTFRLRASLLLQPAFQDSGVDDGFVWVLLASTPDEIERGWQQFVAWRAERVEQAQKLFQQASGADRVQLLKASLSLLEDAGASDDSGALYFQVKAALDSETTRITRLETFHKEFRTLTDSGQLDAAERALDEAQRNGLDQPAYQKCFAELSSRRDQALRLIEAGDDLLREEHYKEARGRYEQAGRIDRNNSLVAGKIATAERFDREARSRAIKATVGFAVPAAVKTLNEYFEYKREEERRKREEEIRKREEAERAAEEKAAAERAAAQREEERDRERRDRSSSRRGPVRRQP